MLHVQELYCIAALGYSTALIDILLQVCTIAEHIVPALAK